MRLICATAINAIIYADEYINASKSEIKKPIDFFIYILYTSVLLGDVRIQIKEPWRLFVFCFASIFSSLSRRCAYNIQERLSIHVYIQRHTHDGEYKKRRLLYQNLFHNIYRRRYKAPKDSRAPASQQQRMIKWCIELCSTSIYIHI